MGVNCYGIAGGIPMLNLYKPKLEDLWFKEKLMNDPDTMSYNHAWGGTIPFPREKWENWHHVWMIQYEHQRYYRYLLNTETNEFVGEIAYYLDNSKNIYIADIIILAKYRCQGYGSEGLKLLCQAAKDNGLTALYDDIAADNPSVHMFLKYGFTIVDQTDDIIMVKRVL